MRMHRFGKRVAGEQRCPHRHASEARRAFRRRASIAEIENLVVESDTPARVVIDERTGTIVIGNDVKISRVAISHGTLTVRITEAPKSRSARAVLQGRDRRRALSPPSRPASPTRASPCSTDPTSKRWSSGLNRLGVKPDGIIAILQGIKSAGALQAELVLQ